MTMTIDYTGSDSGFFFNGFEDPADISSLTSTEIVVTNPTTGDTVTAAGSGFAFDINGDPVSGTITGFTFVQGGIPVAVMANFSWSLVDFVTALDDVSDFNDYSGMSALFSLQDIDLDAQGSSGFNILDFATRNIFDAGLDVSSDVTVTGSDVDDVLGGGTGDDFISTEESNGYDFVSGGYGNDTISYTNSLINYQELSYANDLTNGIVATINGINNTGVVNKGVLGTDTILDIQNPLDSGWTTGGFGLYGTEHADTFNITTDTETWMVIGGGAGADSYNLTIGGTIRLDFVGPSGTINGVSINLGGAGIIDDGHGNAETLTVGGTGRLEIRGSDLADTIIGGSGDDRFILRRGNDKADGGDGYDTLRYDQNGVGDIEVDLTAGTVSGTWGGDAFVDNIKNFEEIRGSRTGNDTMTGDGTSNTFRGRGGDDTLNGLAGNDTLYGEDGEDDLYGGANNDQLYGGDEDASGGNGDDLYGGDGDDQLFGGEGEDALYGEDGEDDLYGGANNDTLNGLAGNDTLYGEDGEDDLYGGANNDQLYGGDEDASGGNGDDLYGGDGDDQLFGGEGEDKLIGGNNNDTFYGGTGNDALFGGSGNDTADYSDDTQGITVVGGSTVTGAGVGTDTLSKITNIQGGSANDSIEGGSAKNSLFGNEGNDMLFGGGGNDMLFGGDQRDTLFGGLGNDKLFGGSGIDTADYSGDTQGIIVTGGNTVTGAGVGTDVLNKISDIKGGSGDDIMEGGNSKNALYGNEGEDLLYGAGGNDKLFGGDDNDTFFGGAGNDKLFGGKGTDTASYADDTLGVTVVGGTTVKGTGVGRDVLNKITKIIGGSAADDIEGGTAKNQLFGGGGNDTLDGADGNDVLYGGAQNDILIGGVGNDRLFGGNNSDTLFGGTGNDTLNGGNGADTFVFVSGDGDDTIQDFTSGTDEIDLSAVFADFAAVLAATNDTGSGAVITLSGGGEILLDGVFEADLTLGDFVFVL